MSFPARVILCADDSRVYVTRIRSGPGIVVEHHAKDHTVRFFELTPAEAEDLADALRVVAATKP